MLIKVTSEDIISQLGITELDNFRIAITLRIDELSRVELTLHELALIDQGKKINAIKQLRGRTNLALIVCKSIVDKVADNG